MIGVSGWMILLVPAHLGNPGEMGTKQLLLLLFLLYLYGASARCQLVWVAKPSTFNCPFGFLCQMPFLLQPSQFFLAWDRNYVMLDCQWLGSTVNMYSTYAIYHSMRKHPNLAVLLQNTRPFWGKANLHAYVLGRALSSRLCMCINTGLLAICSLYSYKYWNVECYNHCMALMVNTHTHNRFTAVLEYVRDHPGEQVPER